MIIDNNLVLSGSTNGAGVWAGQAVTGNGGTTLQSNVIDKAPLAGNQVADWGMGENLAAVITVAEAFAGTSATLQFQIIESASSTLSSPQVLCETAAYSTTELGLGKQIVLNLPRGTPRTPLRYLALQYNIGGTNISAGKVIAALVKDVQDSGTRVFASGFTVA